MKAMRWIVVGGYFLIAALPLGWLVITSFKEYPDTISTTAKFVPALVGEPADDGPAFKPSTEGFRRLAEPAAGTPRSFLYYIANSAIIGLLSTAASVALGTSCAYGFSRFRIAGEKDWLFFILSTRFMPPLAVVAPILILYRQFDLQNSHLGLIILYTCFNLSLAVWLMKGFIDEIPKAYEEAALVDGYSQMHVLWTIILPQARTGMAVTAVFCLISAWNEYAFAVTLNSTQAVTAPVYFAGLQGNIRGVPWPQIAAGVLIFVVPIMAFTVLVRKHLLRGITFGAIKQ